MQAFPLDPHAFAHHWLDAWNRHHLDDILSHYHHDVVFHSPMIARFTTASGGVLSGTEALRAYWSRALKALPDLHFELIEVLSGQQSVTLYYRGHQSNVAETFHFDSEGLVRESHACYGEPFIVGGA